MVPTRIVLQLIGLTLLATSAVAIKCYNCESTTDPECSEITKDTKLQAKNCTTDMAAVETGNWIRALIRLTYFPKEKPSTENMVCQTIVGKRGDNITTVRTCQFDAAQTNQCEVARQQLREKNFQNTEIVSCLVCKEDFCNSATTAQSSQIIALGLAMAVSGLLNRF